MELLTHIPPPPTLTDSTSGYSSCPCLSHTHIRVHWECMGGPISYTIRVCVCVCAGVSSSSLSKLFCVVSLKHHKLCFLQLKSETRSATFTDSVHLWRHSPALSNAVKWMIIFRWFTVSFSLVYLRNWLYLLTDWLRVVLLSCVFHCLTEFSYKCFDTD